MCLAFIYFSVLSCCLKLVTYLQWAWVFPFLGLNSFFSDIDTGDKIYDKYYGIKNILKGKITIVIYIII